MNRDFLVDLKEHIKENFSRFTIIFIASVLGYLVIRFYSLAFYSLEITTSNSIINLLISLIMILFIVIITYIIERRHLRIHGIKIERRHPRESIYMDKFINYCLDELFPQLPDLSISFILRECDMTDKIDALLKTNYPKLPDEIREKYVHQIYKLLKD